MAVSKIHKFSSWTLLILSAISIIVLALFFFGGVVDPAASLKEYNFTNLLLYWVYIIFCLAVLALVVFSLLGFVDKLKNNPKSAMKSLVWLALFVLLFVVAYVVGGTNHLHLGPSFAKYNSTFWLKTTDMWLFVIYFLLIASTCAVVWGSVKKLLDK